MLHPGTVRMHVIVSATLIMACAAFSQEKPTPLPNSPSATIAPQAEKPASLPGGPKNNFKDFIGQTVSPWTVALPAASAGLGYSLSDNTGYGHGSEAYGYRFGVALADNVSGKFMRAFAFPTVFDQVQTYERLGKEHSVGHRIVHAFAHSFVAKTRNGHLTFNMAGVPASWAVAGLGNTYYPDQYTTGWHTASRAGIAQAGYFGTDLMSEFLPDVCRMVHLKCGQAKPAP